jgi:branched-chain amino acid transport system substrate-binding protein
MRRAVTAVFAAVLVAAAAVLPARAADPIKIGFIAPLTGVFAQAGKDMLEGLKLGIEASGGQSAGRKLEVISEDDEGNGATALAKYRKLTTQDRIDVLDGVLLSNIGYGLAPVIERDQLPTLFLTTPDDLTKRKPAKWILRSNFSASQLMHPLGEYAAKTLKLKRVAVIAMDNPFGYEQIGGFQRVFEENGGRVVQRVWVPLNALDFAPYLTQVTKDADGVCAVFLGAQAIRFVKQYQDLGLKGRLPLVSSGIMTDEHVLRSMGDEALGIVSALQWSPTLKNPANEQFMKLAREKLGRTPGYYHAVMYSSGRWIAEAATAMKGNLENKEGFVAALKHAIETTPDPRGPIKLDEFGNPTENVYILKVERVGGKLVTNVLQTYPLVSQFWHWKPEEFLKMPAYSRDYPPARP